MHDRENKKHWTDFFDYIFLINLQKRRDRLDRAVAELQKYNIRFIRVEAVEDDNGAHGLYLTYLKIFNRVPRDRKVLIFEDDVKFLCDPAPVMEKCIEQYLTATAMWNVFYLGVNTHANFENFFKPNILPITPAVDGRSTHAIAFSPRGVALLKLALYAKPNDPVDMTIVREIQHAVGQCYCAYPIIATQYGGYSDIDKKFDDMSYIEQRFNDHVKHLL